MKKLWSDMHSNIHHRQMDNLDQWIEEARARLDFWPIAYYPFQLVRRAGGAVLEDLCPQAEIARDWELIRCRTEEVNREGYPMFMGYEWQGNGGDGDHNVFFLHNDRQMLHPMTYAELAVACGEGAIGIPHHLAYQLGSRGKNWATHKERFSPFAEVFSSHGCSENDTGDLDMERHLHMGPRTGETCYERGLERGLRVGCIASGDNHTIPGVCDHGSMCVLAESNAKEDIWAGLMARRVYGVSRSRMEIDFTVGGVPLGGGVAAGTHEMRIQVRAADAIDRVEILKDNILETMVVHSGSWERKEHPNGKTLRVKFAAEFGWGPNPRIYPDRLVREWIGAFTTSGRLLTVEKLWNNAGQRLLHQDERGCDFRLKTYMSTDTGHWMGPSRVMKEGFVFEVEGTPEDQTILRVNGHEYAFTLRELMKTSRILAEYDESLHLAQDTFGDISHYRDDLIWHNAYKCRLRQAVPEEAYTLAYASPITLEAGSQVRLRVHLKNGDRAWVSPVFAESRL
ncbi:MAG: hypothetical protein IJ157_05630 [Clostridia bacterium]|nr:hypothetical protein [Clostridia bacterium]